MSSDKPSSGSPYPPPPGYPPPRYLPPPPPHRSSPLLGCAFAVSLVANFVALGLIVLMCFGLIGAFSANGLNGDPNNIPLPEQRVSGKAASKNKVAVLELDGVILEGQMSYIQKQIEQAAHDDEVKAVVLRINSPGGSITASDDLHRRLVELVRGEKEGTKPKNLVVSMGSLAASGGYYVAMPGQIVFAERTTLTGSIGVYSSFPNVEELASKYGVKFDAIKQGQIKDSGSMFKEMTPKERQVWQDMVDHAYDQFLDVVVEGRAGKLTRDDLLAPVEVSPVNAGPKVADLKVDPNKEPAKPYKRYRADGGVWTSDKALELKLVDKIGTVDDAVKAAAGLAQLAQDDYKTLHYERRLSLRDLLSAKAPEPPSLLDADRLRNVLTPRIWFLAPGSELAVLGVPAGKD